MPSSLRIAAVYAHPDDGEFFAAGSLIKWVREGHTVFAISATNGDLGTKQPGIDRAGLGRLRAAELGRALQTIGAEPPICLGFPDGSVRENAQALRERLVYFFRKLRIDRVLTFDPWKRYEVHPDHIEVGRMAAEAACFSCFPLLHPEHLAEGLRACQPAEVWFMAPTEHLPNRVVDIEESFDAKVRSLLCHSSQIEMLADWFVPGADPTDLDADQRAALDAGARTFLDEMARGLAHLAPPVTRAEAFFAQKTGPGHFENQRETFAEMAGVAAPAPLVL